MWACVWDMRELSQFLIPRLICHSLVHASPCLASPAQLSGLVSFPRIASHPAIPACTSHSCLFCVGIHPALVSQAVQTDLSLNEVDHCSHPQPPSPSHFSSQLSTPQTSVSSQDGCSLLSSLNSPDSIHLLPKVLGQPTSCSFSPHLLGIQEGFFSILVQSLGNVCFSFFFCNEQTVRLSQWIPFPMPVFWVQPKIAINIFLK